MQSQVTGMTKKIVRLTFRADVMDFGCVPTKWFLWSLPWYLHLTLGINNQLNMSLNWGAVTQPFACKNALKSEGNIKKKKCFSIIRVKFFFGKSSKDVVNVKSLSPVKFGCFFGIRSVTLIKILILIYVDTKTKCSICFFAFWHKKIWGYKYVVDIC